MVYSLEHMPRELTFRLKNTEAAVVPVKVDRKKLYGWTQIDAVDDEGNPCDLASSDDSGQLILSRGGTAMAILSGKGEWVDRSDLVAVMEDGSPAPLITSSYRTLIELERQLDEEEFLDYDVTDFYELREAPASFRRAVGKRIYLFDYTYFDSYETTPALIMESDGSLFMLLGRRRDTEMLCLHDCSDGNQGEDDELEVEGDQDELDFTMFDNR